MKIPEDDYVKSKETPLNLRESYLRQITTDIKPIMKTFTPSMIGQIVHIWYDLHVFVKHAAWNEVGVGHITPFHISIVPRPPEQAFGSSEVFDHENWTPETFNSQVMCRRNRPSGVAEVAIASRYSMKLMLSPEEIANQMMANFASAALVDDAGPHEEKKGDVSGEEQLFETDF